jgi:predicted dehydrogenase
MIRAAIIGVSGFGATHYQDLINEVELGTMQPVAATIINQQEEEAKCAHLRELGCELFEDYRAMLAAWQGRLDVCMIPTGIPLHAPMTVAALEADANVFVEKPAAATVAQVNAMQAAADKSLRMVAVGYQRMYDPLTHELKARILDGAIGELRTVRCWGNWPRLDSYYARNAWAGRLRSGDAWVLDSPFNNALSHYLMLSLFLAGTRPRAAADVTSMQAELYRAHPIESADTACMRIRTASGVEVYFHVTHASETAGGPELEAIGTRGSIAWREHGAEIRPAAGGQPQELAALEHSALRAFMMKNVRARLRCEDEFVCSLDVAGVQTICANGAHASSDVHGIDSRYVTRSEQDDSVKTVIQGVDDIVTQASREGKLFSEMGVPWAAPGKDVALPAPFPPAD